MARGARADQSQQAQNLLYGPRQSRRQGGREVQWQLIKDLRHSYHQLLLEDPQAFFDQLDEQVLLEAGPLPQSSGQQKSWRLVRQQIGQREGFNIETNFTTSTGNRQGSDGQFWQLDEAIEKMAEACERDKKVSLNRDMPVDHLDVNDVYQNLVERAVAKQLKRQGIGN